MPLETQEVIPQDRIDEMTAAGLWPRPNIGDYLDRAAAEAPDSVAITGFNSMRGRHSSVSYRQLHRFVERIAIGLAELGVEKGDVVSYQLPNWWEFAAIHLACARIGAITNPVMPIFRHRELAYMLDYAESKVFIVPREFRGFDHAALARELQRELPAIEHIFVLGGEGEESFEARFLKTRWEDDGTGPALFAARKPAPNDIIEVLYTSGTTGVPKGVMHTANTLVSSIESFIERCHMTPEDVILMSSPMAHQTGFLYGLLSPIVLGAKAVLQDIWEAGSAAQLIQDEGVTFTMASTPFLADLAHAPEVETYDVGTLKTFLSAGAPIPRVLVQEAMEKLDIFVMSGWGMTENGLVTSTRIGDPTEKVFETDGVAVENFAVQVFRTDGSVADADEEGILKAKGSGSFAGYLKRPEDFGTDDDGWFDTGDIARMDRDGYIRIAGRAKDIIIRGGENVPVVEVEELLYRHPSIEAAADVAIPDPRLGERGCAFVQLKPGSNFTFKAMIEHLESHDMAKNYLPERLEIVDAMPRTASGKIQKFELRDLAKGFSV